MAGHEPFLRRALELARENVRAGRGGPFGAIVVREGRVVGEGTNQVTTRNDPTAHAEIAAIRAACGTLGVFSLAGAVIYASCEPCPMCLAAIYWARLDAVYYAATRADAARGGFDDRRFYDELALPPEARRVPARQLDIPGAARVFNAWLDRDDRIPY